MRSAGAFFNDYIEYYVRFDSVLVIYLVIAMCFFIDIKFLHSVH